MGQKRNSNSFKKFNLINVYIYMYTNNLKVFLVIIVK